MTNTPTLEALCEIIVEAAKLFRDTQGPKACRKYGVGALRTHLKGWKGSVIELSPEVIERVGSRREGEAFLAAKLCKGCEHKDCRLAGA